MINITKAVVELIQNGSQPPASWADEGAVHGYLESLTPSAAKIIVQIAVAITSGRLGLVGSHDEVRSAVAEELETRGLVGIDPAVIEAIVTLLFTLVRLLAKRQS